jgi:putative transcriptional regulator
MSRIQVFALGFVSALVLLVALRGPSVTTPAATGLLIPALAPQPPDGEPAPGMFLVATRDLMDPWFGQSVVLLLHHNEGGSLGLIVNRRFQATLSDAIPDLEQPEADRHPVFFGGPLGSHRVFMLLRNDKPVPQTQHIAADIYFSAEREVLDHALQNKTPGNELHFYIGYASWTSGQLAHELARGSWHLVSGNAAVVFEDGAEDLWDQLIDKLEPPGIEVRFDAPDQLLAALTDNHQESDPAILSAVNPARP